jgi:ribonuclease T1
MKILRSVLLFLVVAFVVYVRIAAPTSATTASSTSSGSPPAAANAPSSISGVPQKAIDVLKTVRTTGQPPNGYVGGSVFENRENRLPADGDYREFDVDPHNGQRNAERLIVEWKTKKAWYTGDHYQTFTELP